MIFCFAKKLGPRPDRLNIEDENWEVAIKKALKEKKPEDGWPDDGDEERWENEGGTPEPESSG